MTALRGLFVGLASALFLFLFALFFIAPWNGSEAGLVPWLVVSLGSSGFLRARAARNRPLRIESLENLAVSYRANFFLGVGAAEAPALFAALAVLFFAAKLWVYVEGLAFAVVGLGLIAPTRADIERRQRQIEAQDRHSLFSKPSWRPPFQAGDGGRLSPDPGGRLRAARVRPPQGSFAGAAIVSRLGTTVAKRKTDVGTLYKGSPGQWSWIAHRITGVAIILFLFAHVVDTAVVGWGPTAYDRVVAVYHNWGVRLLELGLVAAVLYHAINGVKIMLFDFWPATTRYMKQLSIGSTGLFLLAMVPITWIMGRDILNLSLGWNL